METAHTEDGLRERKRVALRATIERAAIDLALEHGYDHVTVDMICEAAMVSQRTFFNYFGSKEGVILGATPPLPADDEIEAFIRRTGSNVLGDFVAMFAVVMADHTPDPELFTSRRRIIMSTPELTSKEMSRISEFEDRFVKIVLSRFEAEGRDEATEPDLEDEARMVVSLTIGVMRFVMRKWFAGGSTASTRDLLTESIALIRRITNDTSTPLDERERTPHV